MRGRDGNGGSPGGRIKVPLTSSGIEARDEMSGRVGEVETTGSGQMSNKGRRRRGGLQNW